MRLVVLQSNYIPWKGYFDLVKAADRFVIYDSVQYTKNDWRNRNKLCATNGPIWLTIPIKTAGAADQRISEAEVANGGWARKHWMTIVHLLSKRPFFEQYAAEWESAYLEASSLHRLHDINVLFLRLIAMQLGLDTPIVLDSQFAYGGSSPTDRLVELCVAAGATSYLTGPAGLNYIDSVAFEHAQIRLEVIDYSVYPSYGQGSETFLHGVSALDLLANVGPESTQHLQGALVP